MQIRASKGDTMVVEWVPAGHKWYIEPEPTCAIPYKQGLYRLRKLATAMENGGWQTHGVWVWHGGYYQDQTIEEYVIQALKVASFLSVLLALWK